MRIFATPVANSGEGQVAQVNLTTGLSRRFCGQTLGNCQLGQVDDAVTAAANEMDVGLGIAIEPLHAADGAQAGNQPLLLKKRQVAVHRRQRDVWIFPANLGVNPVGGGVDIRSLDAG